MSDKEDEEGEAGFHMTYECQGKKTTDGKEDDEDEEDEEEEDDEDEEDDGGLIKSNATLAKRKDQKDANEMVLDDEKGKEKKEKEAESEVEEEVEVAVDEDPFDFSASLAKGRTMEGRNIGRRATARISMSKGGTGEEDEEEEEKEDEEEDEEEEEEEETEEEEEKNKIKNNHLESQIPPSALNLDKISSKRNEGSTAGCQLQSTEKESQGVQTEAEERTISRKRMRGNMNVREKILTTKRKKSEGMGERKENVGQDKNPDVESSTNEAVEIAAIEESHTPHRCLIFAQHRQTLDTIEQCVLRRYFPTVGYKRLDGSVQPTVRALIAQRFNSQDKEILRKAGMKSETLKSIKTTGNEDKILTRGSDKKVMEKSLLTDDIRILLMTARSCGLGLNLTAADTVIL